MAAKLGIVAGGGALPLRIAEACRAADRPFFVLGLKGQNDSEDLLELADAWIRLGAVGDGVEHLRRAQVGEIVFAGSVKRPSLAELRPDGFATKVLAKSVMRKGDDGLLRALMSVLEAELGVSFVGPDELLGELVARPGLYGRHAPDDEAWRDIARGVEVAAALGILDVGQAVVVQAGQVLGVEAVEGTDALLARSAELRRDAPGGVLVKLAKPQQDRRADLPTLGVDTVERAAAAGLRGIAVEAGSALVLDQKNLISRADDMNIFIIGIEPDMLAGGPTAPQN